jgi:ABC-type nitrate/sulfonate/bicarbonate transport system permease component
VEGARVVTAVPATTRGRTATAARLGGEPRVVRWLKGTAGVLIAIGLWELVRALSLLPRNYVPSVPDILQAVVDNLDTGLLSAAGDTLQAWALGMLITIAIGLIVGIALGLSHWADAALRVVVEFLRPVPSVALIPVAVLIFGIGLKMQLLLIVFACVWPVLFNVRYGVASVDRLLIDTGRVSGLSRAGVVRRVVLPAALPATFTGVRIASSIALVLAVSSEMVSGSPGLGKLIVDADAAANVELSYAGVFVTGIIGLLLNLAMQIADRRLLPWSLASRGDVA